MNAFTPLIIAVVVSLLLSTAILLAIAKPLRQLLAQICKEGQSTSFWVAFTAVMLYVAPLFIAVFWTPIYNTSMVETLRTALESALFGAFAGLVVIGLKLANARRI